LTSPTSGSKYAWDREKADCPDLLRPTYVRLVSYCGLITDCLWMVSSLQNMIPYAVDGHIPTLLQERFHRNAETLFSILTGSTPSTGKKPGLPSHAKPPPKVLRPTQVRLIERVLERFMEDVRELVVVKVPSLEAEEETDGGWEKPEDRYAYRVRLKPRVEWMFDGVLGRRFGVLRWIVGGAEEAAKEAAKVGGQTTQGCLKKGLGREVEERIWEYVQAIEEAEERQKVKGKGKEVEV
ncbi:hypothetical protein BJ508DRAFT_330782, partial [Ascobolus immersus RN42]